MLAPPRRRLSSRELLDVGSRVNNAVEVGDPRYEADVTTRNRLYLIVAVEGGLQPPALLLQLVLVHTASMLSAKHMGSGRLAR